MAQKIKKILIVFGLLAIVGLVSPPVATFADTGPCGDNCSTSGGPSGNTTTDDGACNTKTPSAQTVNACVKSNPIIHDINVIVNILAALVGVAVTGALVLGGVQYTMAGDSPDAVGKAKKRITNALIALVAFLLTYAFLQWIIPGGVFGS